MPTTELLSPPQAAGSPDSRPAAASPTFGDVFAETLPLVGANLVAGPPVVLVAGPWLLFGLLLAGPFALLLTIVVLIGAAAAVVGLLRAILVVLYRLFRDLRGYGAPRRSLRAPASHLVVRRGTA